MGNKLVAAAEKALYGCLGAKKGEKILIVTDEAKQKIGKAFQKAAGSLSAERLVKKTGSHGGEEPPPKISEKMLKADIIIAPTLHSLTHTTAMRKALKNGARAATLPGITQKWFIVGMMSDYSEIKRLGKIIRQSLAGKKSVRITSPSGTRLLLKVTGKPVLGSGYALKPGELVNLPEGEVSEAIVENTADGELFIDSMGGYITRPAKLSVEKGKIVEYGGNAEKFKKLVEKVDPNASKLCELGIGTNPGARIGKSILESEKVLGTCHIGFGNNMFYPGGTIKSGSHIDGVLKNPTVVVGKTKLLSDGKIVGKQKK